MNPKKRKANSFPLAGGNIRHFSPWRCFRGIREDKKLVKILASIQPRMNTQKSGLPAFRPFLVECTTEKK